MSEVSLTLPHEFPNGTLVLRSLFCVGNHIRKYHLICPVRSGKRATFFLNLFRNIVAMQVDTLWRAYYHVCENNKRLPKFEDFKLLVSSQENKYTMVEYN